MPSFRRLASLLIVLMCALSLAACGGLGGKSSRGNVPLTPEARDKLLSMGSSPAEPMMIRIFKESSELEVWKRTKAGPYKLFASYQICAWSGALGPKVKE